MAEQKPDVDGEKRVPMPSLAAEPKEVQVAIEAHLTAIAARQLLDRFTPATVLIGPTGQVLHSFGPIDRYLRTPSGLPTLNVVTLAREAVKPTLCLALREARRRGREVSAQGTGVAERRRRTRFRVVVTPVQGRTHGFSLVIFDEVAPTDAGPQPRISATKRRVARTLESELRAAESERQAVVERLDSCDEALRGAKAESLAIREELQSTKQELESSRRQLQLLNEELSTVNTQLRENLEELYATKDNLMNLLASTDVALVALDVDLQIKWLTPAACRVLNVQMSDAGRPLNHFASNVVDRGVSRHARLVRDKLTSVESEIATQDGKQYLLHGRPYRTHDGRVKGVVLTLVDVTAVKRAERKVRAGRKFEARGTPRSA